MIRGGAIGLAIVLLAGCDTPIKIELPPAMPPPKAAPAAPISFSDLLARPRQKADARIAYGQDALQFGELWLPKSRSGKLPVVVLIHGGCWQAALPGTELMDYLAADLRDRGFAVWNLEYRRIGHPGGGYPGTFQDVAKGVDHLRVFAEARGLDLANVQIVGHSAGGHLATWAGARKSLPTGSPLRTADPLVPKTVVSLAGINDLAAFRADGPTRCGGPQTIDDLVDARRSGDLYADTSPARLRPSAPQWVFSGELDPIVPPAFGVAFAKAMGSGTVERTIPKAGHFELIDPTSEAWWEIVTVLLDHRGQAR